MAKVTGVVVWGFLLAVVMVATSWAQVKGENAVYHLVGFDGEYDNGTSGAKKTIDWKNGNKQKVLLTEPEVTLAFGSPGIVGNFILEVVSDGGPKHSIKWSSDVKWPGGSAPELTKGPGALDVFSFFYNGREYLGNAALDYR